MTWKDRATVVSGADAAAPGPGAPAGGSSWRDRAAVVEKDPGFVSDVVKNGGKELTDLAKSAPGLVEAGLNVTNIPHDAVRYIGERAAGTPHDQTALAKDLGTVKEVVKSAPGATMEIAKDMAHTVAHPIDSLREKPISTIANVLGAAGGVAGLLEESAPAVAEAATKSANALGRRAAGFTKRFVGNDAKLSKANDAVQWMLNKKIMTPGVDAEEMLSRVSAAKDEAFAQMAKTMKEQNAGARGALSPKSAPTLREQFLFDPKKASGELDALRPRANNGKILTGGEYDGMNSVIDNAQATIAGHGERPIPWDEAHSLKGNLKANWDTTKSDAVNNLKKRVYGVFNDSFDTQLDEAATARGSSAAPFIQAKKDYGLAKTAEKALDNVRSSQAGNRKISLTDTIAMAGGAAAHGSLGAAATLLAKTAIEKYGLTTGASLGQKLAAISANAPRLLGPYAPALHKALLAGGTELATTHAVLTKTDPDYRILVKSLASVK